MSVTEQFRLVCGHPGRALVSVVIPSFNAGRYIQRAILSALGQSYRAVEVIVVDDCSSDDTFDKVLTLCEGDDRIRYVSLIRNSGTPAVPRNVGVRIASGEWIAFLDADDVWHPKKIELQMDEIRRLDAYMCSSEMADFVDEGSIDFVASFGSFGVEVITLEKQLTKYRTPTSSILVKRAAALLYPFPEERAVAGREDLACSLVMHDRMGSSIKVRAPLVYYRKHGKQVSARKLLMYKRIGMILWRFRTSTGSSVRWRMPYYMAAYAIAALYLRGFRRRL